MGRPGRSRTRRLPATGALLGGLSSGLLFALSAEPVGWHWLRLVALVPLLAAILRARRPRDAAGAGFVAGTSFFAVSLYPLVSALDWTGWTVASVEEMAAVRRRQAIFLHVVWAVLSPVGGIIWAVFSVLTRAVAGRGPIHFAVFVPGAWLLICEVFRSSISWDFHWDLLGSTLATNGPLRQVAALGGPWALSLLVLTANLGVVAGWRAAVERDRRWAGVAMIAALLVALCWGWGGARLRSQPHGRTLDVTAVQHAKDTYRRNDFASIGLDRSFLLLLERRVPPDSDLVVLPETISYGALTLDGSRSRTIPDLPTAPVESWSDVLTRILGDRPSRLVLGVETVQSRRLHNSLALWDGDGLVDWYHKRRLVPFAESMPAILATFSARGASQFAAGAGDGILRGAGDLAVGAFICQEVLYPSLIRRTARAGAELLVSGGNDGVFSDRRVAIFHARQAQLRAVESGLPLVRAMKSGRSAIIDRYGRELAASEGEGGQVLHQTVHLGGERTLYLRWGNWLLFLATAVAVVSGLDSLRTRRRG